MFRVTREYTTIRSNGRRARPSLAGSGANKSICQPRRRKLLTISLIWMWLACPLCGTSRAKEASGYSGDCDIGPLDARLQHIGGKSLGPMIGVAPCLKLQHRPKGMQFGTSAGQAVVETPAERHLIK